MAAYSNCRLKKRKLDPYVAKADTELADSTITSPIVVRRAVDSEAAASTRRAPRSARARATAGATSPGRTTRSRGRADITASLRMRPPPGRLRATRPCGHRPGSCGEAFSPFPVVAEHVLACAVGRQDDGSARRSRPVGRLHSFLYGPGHGDGCRPLEDPHQGRGSLPD